MFIEVNERIINLSKVSSIKIYDEYVSYNFCHEINIIGKLTVDTYKDKNRSYKFLDNDYFNENFLVYPEQFEYVNKNCIASVSFDDSNNKIIFNFCFSVDIKNIGRISKFVYWKFKNRKYYEDAIEYVKKKLGIQ